jgi:hypothetical protein
MFRFQANSKDYFSWRVKTFHILSASVNKIFKMMWLREKEKKRIRDLFKSLRFKFQHDYRLTWTSKSLESLFSASGFSQMMVSKVG